MAAPARVRNPQAVLFACGLNSVRSPMAASLLQQMFPQALYVRSAGAKKGELDPFAVAVMDEVGIDISRHKPIDFEELEDLEGLNFDLIVTLSPPAHHKALELTRTVAAELLEDWEASVARFTEVMPSDYKRVLEARAEALEEGLSEDEAAARIMEVLHG